MLSKNGSNGAQALNDNRTKPTACETIWLHGNATGAGQGMAP